MISTNKQGTYICKNYNLFCINSNCTENVEEKIIILTMAETSIPELSWYAASASTQHPGGFINLKLDG